jgi:hypothetical protein
LCQSIFIALSDSDNEYPVAKMLYLKIRKQGIYRLFLISMECENLGSNGIPIPTIRSRTRSFMAGFPSP